MSRFKTGDRVRLNSKYIDKRDRIGEEFIVTAVADICGKECVWTEPPLGGGYASDGFDLIERGE